MAIVDANVFLHGRANYRFDQVMTVQDVVDEVKSEQGRTVLGKLDYEVREPGEEAVSKVKQKSREINSPTSEEDEKLLALAMEKEGNLVTDDKPLQNLALHLGVEFTGYLEGETERLFRWEEVCANCGEKVGGDKCLRCGSNRIRRKRVPHS